MLIDILSQLRSYIFFGKFYRFNKRLSCGKNVSINSAKIYSKTYIGDFTHVGDINIKGNEDVTIGKFCAIGYDVKIFTSDHIYTKIALQSLLYRKYFGIQNNINKGVKVGNDVWIGDNVTILPGVIIGDGAIIGVGSIVTKNIEPYTINAGVPSKKIGDRFSPEVRNKIMKIEWWNWPIEKIIKNRSLFLKDNWE